MSKSENHTSFLNLAEIIVEETHPQINTNSKIYIHNGNYKIKKITTVL